MKKFISIFLLGICLCSCAQKQDADVIELSGQEAAIQSDSNAEDSVIKESVFIDESAIDSVGTISVHLLPSDEVPVEAENIPKFSK